MGAEVVAVWLLVSRHGRLVAAEQAFELVAVGIAVGAVGEHDNAVAVEAEQPVERLDRALAVAEGRIGLFDLLDPRILHDADAFPVAGKTFEEVIPLHVAIVIRAGHVGRIEIDQVNAAGLRVEHVGTLHDVAAAVVEHHAIEGFHLFDEVLLHGEPQVAAAIVVVGEIAGDGEHATRLLLQAGADQGGTGEGLLVRVLQLVDIRGNPVQKPQVFRRVEDAGKRLLR